jgi:polar amino acid transport system substrate-binding protein
MKKIIMLFTLTISIFTLAACEAEGPLRVAMDLGYPPFETVDTMNSPEGISVDIALAFGEFLGREVEIVNTAFGSIIPALEAGEVDIAIASMSYTEERDEKVDFSDFYFYFKIITLVNKAWATTNNITEDSTIEDLENSGGRFTGIASQVSASIPAEYGITVTEAANLGTAVENVKQGTADILLMSANPVVQAYNANPDDLMVVWSPWVSSPIAMAVQEGNSELQQLANDFIATFNDEGGMYDQLKADWDSEIIAQLGRFGLDFYINED